MIFSPRRYAGMELTDRSIKVAQLEKKKKRWQLNRCSRVPLPEGTVRFNFNNRSIVAVDKFTEGLKKAMRVLEGRTSVLGLAIPNEIVKIILQQYKELPDNEADIEKVVAWQTGKSYRFPMKKIRIAYHIAGRNAEGEHQLMVAAGARRAIAEYEAILGGLSLQAPVICPSAVHLANFYMPKLPQAETFAFACFFHHYVSLMVFDRGHLAFIRGVKKKFNPVDCYRSVSMMLMHYGAENPGKESGRLYIDSQAGARRELERVFREMGELEVSLVDPEGLVSIAAGHPLAGAPSKLSAFTAAIAAAQSLEQ
jgi:hypothetical protein